MWTACLLLLLLPGLAMCQQSFSVRPSATTVASGASATLLCVIRAKSSRSTCVWQKDGRPVGRLAEGKYVWRDDDGDDCTITIHHANVDTDDGEFRLIENR